MRVFKEGNQDRTGDKLTNVRLLSDAGRWTRGWSGGGGGNCWRSGDGINACGIMRIRVLERKRLRLTPGVRVLRTKQEH